ncbi:MAG: hypothetical protein AABZ32_12790 [Bacteroidota bacterium]
MITPISRFSFCLFSILLAFSSCKNKTDYSKEISLLDSAVVKLKEAETFFLSADTGSLRSVYDFSQEKLKMISEKIAKDTVKKKTAVVVSDAYQQSGNIRNLLDNKKYLERAIKESQQRISDLKHDLTEDFIEKNKSTEYILNEMNASQKIYETIRKAIEKAKASATKLDSLKTQISFIADSLKSK